MGSANVLKNFFYLGVSSRNKDNITHFRDEQVQSNIFFAPLVTSMHAEEEDVHSIYIVPMTIPRRLGRLTTSPQYKKLL